MYVCEGERARDVKKERESVNENEKKERNENFLKKVKKGIE